MTAAGGRSAGTPRFVLLHWPILGPASLGPLAAALAARAVESDVLDLHARADHLDAAIEGISRIDTAAPLVLVAHSGAGHLLPELRTATQANVAGYVIMDGSLPEDGKSRLDLTAHQGPDVAAKTIARLDADGVTPRRELFDYAGLIPDAALAAAIAAEHQAQPRAYWATPVKVFDGWPDAPAGYVSSSPGYVVFADLAEERGWKVVRLSDGSQLDPVLRAGLVADALVTLGRSFGALD